MYNIVVMKERKDKNIVKNSIIDEETYNKLNIDLKDIYEKYRDVLNRNLQVAINALKEMIINEK